MRKLAAAMAALPVLGVVYLATLGRAGVLRIAAGVAAGAVVALVVVASLPTSRTNAIPASQPRAVDARLIDAVLTGQPLGRPFSLQFDAPMDPASVAAALRIEPDIAVRFAWDASGRNLRIAPLDHWRPDTLYTVTVAATARAADGGTLSAPLRSLILTSRAGTVSIAPTRPTADGVRLDSAFRISLDRTVDAAVVRAALRFEPAVPGVLTAGATDHELVYTPDDPLVANASYTLTLVGLVDADGVPFDGVPAVEVRTIGAPDVVRFRPRDGQDEIPRNAALSVRFTERMDRTTTATAFHAIAAGKAVSGTSKWAEGATVLVFTPSELLPYGVKVELRVDATATSKSGVALAAVAIATFTTEPKPAARQKPADKPTTKPRTKPIPKPPSGGGGAVNGSWAGVESYYLGLMNCTRTGGLVTSGGKCSSPGGRSVAALTLNSGVSRKVSRPYAKLLATRGQCDHFIGGTPGDRLRRQGYTSYRWAENLGCRSGNPYSAVLGSHLYFQSERPYNGGHYRNLMDAKFHTAGIGVWVSGGRVRLVVDFYTP